MYSGYNRATSRKSVDIAVFRWVVLPDEPRSAKLVYVDGRFVLVFDDGSRVPVVIEASGEAVTGLEPLPEPDYESYYRWCVKGTSEKTCRRYASYLSKLP